MAQPGLNDGNTNSSRLIRRNHIRQEVIYRYTVSKWGEERDSVLMQTIQYDTAGRITERREKLPGMKKTFVNRFVYDAAGRLKQELTTYAETGELLGTTGFYYDTVQHMSTRYHLNKDTTHMVAERRWFNAGNQLLTVQTRINNGNYYSSQKYLYDSTNHLRQMDAYDSLGKLTYSYLFMKDSVEHSVTKFWKRGRDIQKQEVYRYNQSGECISRWKYSPDEPETPKEIVDISYRPDGTLLTSITREDNRIRSVIKHYYQYN